MSLNQTPSAERTHIAFFGRRNVGKSSLVNAVTGQALSVVSDVRGTTTDPVSKAMELLPLGPVLIIDTPGFDDEGELGSLRVEKTKSILTKTDIAVLVTDATAPLLADESDFWKELTARGIPCLLVHNKADLLSAPPPHADREIWVSAEEGTGIEQLKAALATLVPQKSAQRPLVSDLLSPGDTVVLVCPIDASAPKGRLILPQQQTIRDVLDAGCSALVCRDSELAGLLGALQAPPRMVITDSQVFGSVAKIVPADIPLTSFSILFARYKGDLSTLVRGAAAIASLRDGDRILISEGCTHHRQCGDIGSVKIPALLQRTTGAALDVSLTSGGEFPTDLTPFRLVVHCGGCMLNGAEMSHRLRVAAEQGVPMVNYGVALAYMNGILRRSLELFPDVLSLL